MVATEPYKVVGTRPIRPDGVDKVTGRANYGADIKLQDLLYARVKRSPHAHAIIKSIDVSKALALPGVKAVVTRADFRETADGVVDVGEGPPVNLKFMVDNVCAGDKVLYRGHPVAAVAATDLHTAEDAMHLIEVEYEVLPPVMNVRDAMLESAPLLHGNSLTGAEKAEDVGKRPSNIAARIEFEAGDIDSRLRRGRHRHRA